MGNLFQGLQLYFWFRRLARCWLLLLLFVSWSISQPVEFHPQMLLYCWSSYWSFRSGNNFILFNNSMLHLSRPHICRLWLLIACLLMGNNDPISLYHHLQHWCMVSLFHCIVIFDPWSVIKVWFLIFPPWMAISSWFLLLFTFDFAGQDVSLSSMISLIFFNQVLTCWALNHAPYWLLSCPFSIFCFSLQFFSVSNDATIVVEVWASFIFEIYPVINQFTLIVLHLNCSWVMSAFTSTFMYFLSLIPAGEHPPNFYPGILADVATRFTHLHSQCFHWENLRVHVYSFLPLFQFLLSEGELK